jgi:hypothetical protein
MAETLAAEKRAEIEAETKASADARHARSPEGRREAAQRAVEAREAQERDAQLARELIVAEGAAPADVEGLSDVEALHYGGFRWSAAVANPQEKDRKADEMARSGEWAEMPDSARVEWARALNISDLAVMDRYASDFGVVRPTFSKDGDPGPSAPGVVDGDEGAEGGDSE